MLRMLSPYGLFFSVPMQEAAWSFLLLDGYLCACRSLFYSCHFCGEEGEKGWPCHVPVDPCEWREGRGREGRGREPQVGTGRGRGGEGRGLMHDTFSNNC